MPTNTRLVGVIIAVVVVGVGAVDLVDGFGKESARLVWKQANKHNVITNNLLLSDCVVMM